MLIEVEHLTIGYGDNILLEDVAFSVKRGEIFAILGGSGSGKSSLVRHLVGLERPLAGRISLDGLGDPSMMEESAPRFGVLFQSGALFGSLTLSENIDIALKRWTNLERDAIEAIARARLRVVGLQGFENHYPAEISGGMRKRAGIARALALDPPLLFFDEPSAGLDPVTAVGLDDLILTLNRNLGITVVIVTHELASIFAIVSRCIMLDKKRRMIVASGVPSELRDSSDDPLVRAFFNRTANGD